MGKLRRDGESAWHTSEAAEVLRALETDAESGLSDKEVARRLAEQGPNELEEKGGRDPWAILWEQFTSAMIVILIVAAVASALTSVGKAPRARPEPSTLLPSSRLSLHLLASCLPVPTSPDASKRWSPVASRARALASYVVDRRRAD